MTFVFWVIFFLICLSLIGKVGFLGFIGGMLLLFVFMGVFYAFWMQFVEDKKFRIRVLKKLRVILLAAAIAYPIWYVTCNVIYNRYELNVHLSENIPLRSDPGTTVLNTKDYTKLFLAKNDSEAIARVKPYIMKKAKWFSTSPKPVRIGVGAHLYNNTKDYPESRVEYPDGFIKDIHNEICTLLQIEEIPEKILNSYVKYQDTDSLEQDTLGY